MGETRPKPKLPKCLNYGLVSATIINQYHQYDDVDNSSGVVDDNFT
jgi:hypothetical protein